MISEKKESEKESKMEVKIKNRSGLRTSNTLLWVLAVVSGTVLGVAGSFAASISAMNDYRRMYNDWIGTDTTITESEAQRALEWIQSSHWVV